MILAISCASSVTLAQDPKATATPGALKTAVGSVKAASADTIVVAGAVRGKDTEWTFAIDATTKVRKAGRDVTPAEVKPGDPVQVRYLEREGTSIARNIAVTAPAKTR
jgi:hypothetical protein